MENETPDPPNAAVEANHTSLWTWVSRAGWLAITLASVIYTWTQVSAYLRDLTVKQLEATDELHTYMKEIQSSYGFYCSASTEEIKPTHLPTYAKKVELAGVDMTTPPYDRPCRRLRVPGAGSVTGLKLSIGNQLQYGSWAEFAHAEPKRAVIWIEGVPIILQFAQTDAESLKADWQEMKDELKTCVADSELDPKFALAKDIECRYFVSEDFEVKWYATGTVGIDSSPESPAGDAEVN